VRAQLKTSSNVVRTDADLSKERFDKAQEKATAVLEKAVKKQEEHKKSEKKHGKAHKRKHNKKWYQKRKQQWLRKNRKAAIKAASKQKKRSATKAYVGVGGSEFFYRQKTNSKPKPKSATPSKSKSKSATPSKPKTTNPRKMTWLFRPSPFSEQHAKLPSPKDLALVLKSFKENRDAGKLDQQDKPTTATPAAAKPAATAHANDKKHGEKKTKANHQSKSKQPKSTKAQETKREKAARKNLDLQRKLGRIFHIGRMMVPYKLSADTKREWRQMVREYKELLKGELGKREVQTRMKALEKRMVAQVRAHPPMDKRLPKDWEKQVRWHPFRVFNTLLRRSRFADAKDKLHAIEKQLMDKKKPITTVAAWSRVQQLVRQHQIPADWAAQRRIVKSPFSSFKPQQHKK